MTAKVLSAVEGTREYALEVMPLAVIIVGFEEDFFLSQ